MKLQISVVNPHFMQSLQPNQEIFPNSSRLLLAELVFMLDHVVVEIFAVRIVLSHDVIVGLRLEKIDDLDDLGNVSCLLQG